jgi:hypothetical protein
VAQTCENLDKCGFFKQHGGENDLACKWYIREYCNGSKQAECKRKQYKQENGTPPADDMLPSGQAISSQAR